MLEAGGWRLGLFSNAWIESSQANITDGLQVFGLIVLCQICWVFLPNLPFVLLAHNTGMLVLVYAISLSISRSGPCRRSYLNTATVL
jgi:hypothetical protein